VRRSSVLGAGCLLLLGAAGCGADQDHVLGTAAKHSAVAQAQLASVGPVSDLSARKVPVDTYATSVCAGLARFGVDFHTAKDRRSAGMNGSPAATRAALLLYYDALDSAFDKMVATTQRAGIPNLSDGKAVAAGVVSTLGEARKAGDAYRPKAQALSGKDAKDTKAAAQKIADGSDRDVANVMHRLSRYDGDPKFRAAFTKAITCQHR
jgi:hypothetical protein